MKLAEAIERVRSAIDNRPNGFVAVAIDIEVLERVLRAAKTRTAPARVNQTSTFDDLAAEFQRETGLFAPGKDVPPGYGGEESTYADRLAAWDGWLRRRAPVGRP